MECFRRHRNLGNFSGEAAQGKPGDTRPAALQVVLLKESGREHLYPLNRWIQQMESMLVSVDRGNDGSCPLH